MAPTSETCGQPKQSTTSLSNKTLREDNNTQVTQMNMGEHNSVRTQAIEMQGHDQLQSMFNMPSVGVAAAANVQNNPSSIDSNNETIQLIAEKEDHQSECCDNTLLRSHTAQTQSHDQLPPTEAEAEATENGPTTEANATGNVQNSPSMIDQATQKQGQDLQELLRLFKQTTTTPISNYVLQTTQHKP
jgi:hypothetical protein